MVFLSCFFFNLSISIPTELLEKSLALLNKSHELTEFIEEFKREGPNANPELIQGAQSSCLKIDNLLELLQDRRRQLDRSLKHQRRGLEQVLQICLWHQQENQVRCIKVQSKANHNNNKITIPCTCFTIDYYRKGTLFIDLVYQSHFCLRFQVLNICLYLSKFGYG